MKEDVIIKCKTSLEKTGNIDIEASILFNRNTSTITTSMHVQNRVQSHVQNRVENRDQNHVRNCVQNNFQNRDRKLKKDTQ